MAKQVLATLVLLALSVIGAVAQPLEGRLKIVHDTATLRIGYRTDSRPLSFLDAQGHPAGYTIELCQRIGKFLEGELALPSLAINWVPVDTRSRFQAIIEGSADMECGSTSVSFARMRIVDFSSLVFADSTGVLVKAGTGLRASNLSPESELLSYRAPQTCKQFAISSNDGSLTLHWSSSATVSQGLWR